MKLKENRFEYKTYGSDIERNLTNILILLNIVRSGYAKKRYVLINRCKSRILFTKIKHNSFLLSSIRKSLSVVFKITLF